jgi:death on curing protein
MKIYLPTRQVIIDLHEAILKVSGGRPGILHSEEIDSAVIRPKTHLAYQEDCDLHLVCAVLLDSLARNHAFIEGNKRTGLMTAILTYELNGIMLKRSADRHKEFEKLVLWVVKKKPEIQAISEKLKELTGRYKTNTAGKYTEKLRSVIPLFDSDDQD